MRSLANKIASKYNNILSSKYNNISLERDVFLSLENKQILRNYSLINYLKQKADNSAEISILKGAGINAPICIRGHGKLIIGKYTAIGKELKVLLSNHSMTFANIQLTLQNKMNFSPISGKTEKVEIGHTSWIGDRVIFLPGSSVGIGSVVGAGSVVTKNLPPFQVIAGNPARIIRPRFSKNIQQQLLEIAWWNWSEEKIKRNQTFFEQDLGNESNSINLKTSIVE